jgi:uncharacterized membrane protein
MEDKSLELNYYEELKKARETALFIKKLDKNKFFKTLNKTEKSDVTILSRFIIVVAITGDLLGLIPFVGSVIAIIFGIILAILYFFDAIGRGFFSKRIKKLARKLILKGFILVIEFLFSPIPIFTAEALIHNYLLKRGYYKKIIKAKKIIDKVK